jgi:hypothetical protein
MTLSITTMNETFSITVTEYDTKYDNKQYNAHYNDTQQKSSVILTFGILLWLC